MSTTYSLLCLAAILLLSCQSNSQTIPKVEASKAGKQVNSDLDSEATLFTHSINYFAMKAFSFEDARFGFLKEEDKVKVIGQRCHRQVSQRKDSEINTLSDTYLIDPFWDGSPTLILENNTKYGSCNDIIALDSLILTSKPIEFKKLDSIMSDFAPLYGNFEAYEYVQFMIRKGTFCNIISESESCWEVGFFVNGSNFTGYLPKTIANQASVIRKCEFVGIEDSRNSFIPPNFPKEFLGKYEGDFLDFPAPFTLEISLWDGLAVADVTTFDQQGNETKYEKIWLGYDPNSDLVSFWGPQQRTEIKILGDGTFTGTARRNNCKGRRLE